MDTNNMYYEGMNMAIPAPPQPPLPEGLSMETMRYNPPEGFAYDDVSGLFYSQTMQNDGKGGKVQVVTWFDSNSGNFSEQSYPVTFDMSMATQQSQPAGSMGAGANPQARGQQGNRASYDNSLDSDFAVTDTNNYSEYEKKSGPKLKAPAFAEKLGLSPIAFYVAVVLIIAFIVFAIGENFFGWFSSSKSQINVLQNVTYVAELIVDSNMAA